MISILSSKVTASKIVDGARKSREVFCLVGLSSDTKPTTSYKGILICNGSVYDEIDTGKEYLYDEAGGEWHEQPDGDKKKDDPTAEEISVSRGSADAGKVIVVGNDGKLLPVDLDSTGEVAIDRTLSVSGAAAGAKETGDAISALNGSLGTYAVGKNLVGAENGKLYPVYLPQSGMKITVSSVSGESTDTIYLNLFDANGVYKTYYNISRNMLPRTITVNHSGSLYVCITKSTTAAHVLDDVFQVELGSQATAYEEYFSNAKSLSKKVESLRWIVFEQGSIRAGNDEYSYTSIKNRVRSNRFRLTQPIKITPKDGYKVYYTQIIEGTPASPGWRTAPYVLNNAECEYRICVAAIDDSNVGFGNIEDYIEIEIVDVPLHGKNLVGQESGVLYPVDIVKNQTYTMSTKNGDLVEGYIQLNFYSETKERINYAVFTKGLSERTLTWSDNTPVKYVMLLTDEGAMGTQIQLEYGSTKTSFADYVNLDAEKNKPIKDYYYDEMIHSLATVKSLITEPALVFPIITDIHFMSSSNHNPLLILDSVNNIEHFLNKVRCDFVLNLGDNTDGDNAVSGVTKARNAVVVNKLAGMGIPYYQALGNHDTNYYSGSTFTMAEIFSSYFASTKKDNIIFNPNANGTEYYVDYPGVGVRVVVLNANYGTRYAYSATTGAWLESDALQTEYIVLLCEHLSSIRTQNWENRKPTNADSITSALQAFVNGGGTLIQLCGHSHCDYAFESPWLSVFSNCNKTQKVNLDTDEYRAITGYSEALYAPERVVGTVSEDCWSIGILRPTARKLNLIRFGAGEDREYTF